MKLKKLVNLSCSLWLWKIFFFSALTSFKYEIICVLFNIGALQSAVAATQILETDGGLKLAAKLFQVMIKRTYCLKNV